MITILGLRDQTEGCRKLYLLTNTITGLLFGGQVKFATRYLDTHVFVYSSCLPENARLKQAISYVSFLQLGLAPPLLELVVS